MSITRQPHFSRLIICVILMLGAAPLLSAQAGWKANQDRGFSFSYPSDWNCIEVGGGDYGGVTGYIKALSPPGEQEFAMVVMLFPSFTFNLKAEKLTYEDFMKMVFESALEEAKQAGVEIEKTEASLKHGPVPAFMAIKEESEEAFKASIICGDLIKNKAAIIMVTMNLSGEGVERGKLYLEQTEQIMASFAFPK
jgi:hypothetical protein